MRSFLGPFLICAVLSACGSNGGAGKRQSTPLVSAYKVTTHRFADRIEAVGTANAKEQVTLAAPVTQRIVRVDFRDGQLVGKGQVIAVLAQDEQAASLAEATARTREAEQQLERLKVLKARGFATNASLDAQIALAGAARAQAGQARATIADRTIRAPFSGYISIRNISPGAVAQAGTAIATIADLSEIKLDFAIPETMLSAVAEGQSIVAHAAAYPDTPFRGTIATINPIVDPQTRSVIIRAVLPNPDRRLRPGMLMTVGIESHPRERLGVPELAVVNEGSQRFVFVIGQGGKVRRVPVKTGTRHDGIIEIIAGLHPGQQVVGEGVVKVADGMTVRTQAAPAAPAG